MLTDYRRVIGNPSRLYWILGFGVFACASFTWSAVPELSLRGGLQYLSTIVCALIASRLISIRTMLSGLSIGVAVVLVYSLLFGEFSYDPLDGKYSFVGAFGSKNQLGLYASLGAYTGLVSFFIMRSSIISRVWSAFSCAFALFCLSASQSATSAITLVVAIAAVLVGMFLRRFAPRHRTVFFLVLIPLAMVALLICASTGLVDILLGMFGKDMTLTGRTYLWQRGFEIAQENPILGEGFQSFWVQGFSRAEILWNQFYIPSRTGFHFHNTYIETMVELGYVGLFLLSVIVIVLLAGQLKRLLAAGSCREDVVMLGFTTLFISRSFVEIDFLNQYTIGSFLVYYAAGLIARPMLSGRAKKTGSYAMSLRPV
ncbi:O-antigen ligase family protein [Rhizobium sp. BR 362]|uniref:O-antigen ligase family protein n=1 Tax=Rhizobium sp. BR 362 TaxID=3040670 RepID=UPI002F3E9421